MAEHILPMHLQMFADPDDGSQAPQPSSASTEPSSTSTADVAELQRRLANVTAQRDGLLAKQRSQPTPSSASSAPASSAQPASSAANNDSALQAQIDSLTAVNNSLAAYQQATTQRDSFAKKAAKDGISLTDDDFDMILGASDQNKAYKYIKSLKGSAPKHPDKSFPNSNPNPPSKSQNNSIGKELFGEFNRTINNDALNSFIPGHK